MLATGCKSDNKMDSVSEINHDGSSQADMSLQNGLDIDDIGKFDI